MKRTALLAAFFITLATPAFSHEALPQGHVHGFEALIIGGALALLLLYVLKKNFRS